MFQQTDDHDFIPDEWQSPSAHPDEPLAKPAAHDEHDFGQMAKRSAKPAAEKLEKPEEKRTLPKSLGKEANKSWEPLDVSSGIYRGKNLHVSKNAFEHHVRDDTKSILPKFSQRNAFAKGLSAVRSNKITKTDMRKVIGDLEQNRTISSKKARQLRRATGATRSGIF